MANLAQQVKEYIQKKGEFKELERKLFEEMKKSFTQEVPILNAKLPKEYSISNYGVCYDTDGTPKMGLSPPNKKQGYATKDEMDRLNGLLSEEFKRIEIQRGYKISGFEVTYKV